MGFPLRVPNEPEHWSHLGVVSAPPIAAAEGVRRGGSLATGFRASDLRGGSAPVLAKPRAVTEPDGRVSYDALPAAAECVR